MNRKPATDASVKAFFLVCLLGAPYLAADESMAIHETIGHNMQFLADLPGVHRPDDVILAAYIVPALFVLARFRKVILSSRGALAFFALGLGLFVVAGAFDVIGVGIDELVEPLAAACIVGGFTRIALGSRGSCCATEPCDPNSVQPLHRIPIQPSQAQSMNRRVPKLRQEVRALPVVQHSGNVVKVS